MDRRAIVIDCDPGKDDAVAIWVAAASPELEILRVTTVGGNVGLARTTANALAILGVAGRADVPVHAGCPLPLLRPQATAESVHGTTGIDGADLPPARTAPAPGHGAVMLVEAVMGARGPITIAALAPLTNLAVALAMEPRIAERVERLVIMGGGFAMANMTAFAEFNVYVDPHAAAVVLRSGAPITLVPLDVTRRVLATEPWLARLEALGRTAPRATAGMYRASPDLALHDPCVIAWLLRPDLFESRPAHVAVVTEEGAEVGRTVMVEGKAPNARVLLGVDSAGVLDLVAERLARL
ncbi:MAG: nucleoside hydrolase [Alphaproteobacteria bacterium]